MISNMRETILCIWNRIYICKWNCFYKKESDNYHYHGKNTTTEDYHAMYSEIDDLRNRINALEIRITQIKLQNQLHSKYKEMGIGI